MAYENILYEVENAVATVTINRPKALNALNPQVIDEVEQVFEEIAADDNVKAVVLTGAGDKAFVAGADITSMAQMTALEGRAFSRRGQEVLFKIEKLAKPVIAAVNGFALGGGTEISLACDFIYASKNAKFGLPEITLGIVPGFGGTQRLGRVVGVNWAKELSLTGEIISADMAKEIGLVNRIFEPGELMPAAMKTAGKMAQMGRVALRAIKTLINDGSDLPMERSIPMESECFATCFASPDQKEGMTAFIEKRKPKFTGGA